MLLSGQRDSEVDAYRARFGTGHTLIDCRLQRMSRSPAPREILGRLGHAGRRTAGNLLL